MSINRFFFSLLLLLGFMLSIGCNTSTLSPTPQALGGLNKIAIVADQKMWNSEVGDSLKYYLATAYPVLPQPEPLFDLQHYTVESMEQYPDRYRFKNLIFLADMSDEFSDTARKIKEIVGKENVDKMMRSSEKSDIKISKDRWANGQTVLFFYTNGKEAISENLREKSSSIAQLARENDQKMLREREFLRGRNAGLLKEIKEKMGFTFIVPAQYKKAYYDAENNFMWLRKLDPASHIHSNILIHKIPFKNKEQFTTEYVKEIRNQLGKKYVESGDIKGSYMRTNDIDLPLYTETATINGNTTLKVYGIWEMSAIQDMMGGAFISFLVHDEKGGQLVLLDGFTFAPGRKKRDMMQALEMILSTIKFNEESNE